MVSTRLIVTGATVAAVLLATSSALAQEYYIDPAGNDSNSGTSPDEPWATLANLSSARGDVYFKAGGQWEASSGLRISGVTYARYGDGAAPLIRVTGSGSFGASPVSLSGDGVVDGLHIQGVGGTGITISGSNNLAQNCDVDGQSDPDGLQMGIGVMGENNRIIGNYVHDIAGMTGDSGDMNTSGGAEGIMVMASNNEIAYNSVVNCWGENTTLGGAEGGCMEIVNGAARSTIENVSFHHNYCERSVGMWEGCSGNFQGTDAIQENHGIIKDVVLAYNLSVDAMWLYLLQPVNTDFINLVFEHNTLVHTAANGDIPQQGAASFGLLVNDDQGYSADPLQPGSVIVRNNIFYVNGGANAMFTEVPDHYNNLFAPSVPMSWSLGTGELEVSDPGLTADYRLAAGSPAIDAGSSDAWQQWTDFDGNAVPLGEGRDIGVSEYCEGEDCEEPTELVSTGGTTGTGGATSTGGTDSGPAGAGGTSSGGADSTTGGDGATTGGTTTSVDATGGDGNTTSASGAPAAGGTVGTSAGGAPATGGVPATDTPVISCAEGLSLCGDLCVDLSSDATNCGGCNVTCAAGEVCSEGECRSVCGPGLTQCGQACVDLNSNLLHCGACDASCLVGQQCVNGQCTGTATGGDPSVPVAVTGGDPPVPATATGGAPSLPGEDSSLSVPPASDSSAATVLPGEPTGCACSTPGGGGRWLGAVLSVLLGLLAVGRRRQR
jgi:MYXO-CTERM domain-containing protein